MSFFNLKDKSEDDKKKFSLVFSGVLTAIIAILWFSYKITGFGNFSQEVTSLGVNLQAKVEGGLTDFFSATDGSIGSIKETFSKIKESLYNQDNKIEQQ